MTYTLRTSLVIAFAFAAVSASGGMHLHESTSMLAAPPSAITGSYFGLHIHRPSSDTWPQVPFGEWRLWDSITTAWYNLEPRRDQWDFSKLDRYVDMASHRHIGLLLTLGQSPPWASSRPNDPPTWRPGGPAPPKTEEDWKIYVKTVAVRYRGRIHEYEIWNEPNLWEFYSGTPEQMLVLARDAYQIIHSVDPEALVVSPSPTSALSSVDFGVPWLSTYLGLGGASYADVIGYHFYTINRRPEDAISTIRRVRALLSHHGIDKPLWNTETGYYIQSDFTDVQRKVGLSRTVLSQEEAIAFVMRAYLINWANGVTRLYWYDWDSDIYGLGDNDGRVAKTAALGFDTIERWLLGWTMRSCSQDVSNNWTCELTRHHSYEWIIWNPREHVDGPAPSGSRAERYTTLSANGSLVSGRLPKSHHVLYSPIPTLLQ